MSYGTAEAVRQPGGSRATPADIFRPHGLHQNIAGIGRTTQKVFRFEGLSYAQSIVEI